MKNQIISHEVENIIHQKYLSDPSFHAEVETMTKVLEPIVHEHAYIIARELSMFGVSGQTLVKGVMQLHKPQNVRIVKEDSGNEQTRQLKGPSRTVS